MSDTFDEHARLVLTVVVAMLRSRFPYRAVNQWSEGWLAAAQQIEEDMGVLIEQARREELDT